MSEEQIRAEFEAWWANFKSEHEEWRFADREAILFQAWQAALSAKSVPEADEATTELRVVYEAARKFLRYNGVDKDKVNQALDELDEAIEAVKHIDGGYKDFPLEAALSAKSVPDRSFMDLGDSDYVAKRFRLILSKLGISTPESDEELLLGAFSYLGMARRALEDILTAPQPPTDERARELCLRCSMALYEHMKQFPDDDMGDTDLLEIIDYVLKEASQ